MVSGEPFVTGARCAPRRLMSRGSIRPSVMADTTAKTSICQPKPTLKKLTSMAAAAPTANQTETSAVVAASPMMNATTATSHKIVSNHMEISFQGQKAAL